ncbi:MAG TPA: glycosyltransferase, partial [Burkholderiaceae bacterium]|nr:glycosyltransferase [Burkholderiaceae bacterium]
LNCLGDLRSHWWRRVAIVGVLLVVLRYIAWRTGATVPWGSFSPAALYMQAVMLFELAWVVEIVQALYFFCAPDAKQAHDRDERGVPRAMDRALRRASVDVFIPTYNEGPEIIERTLLAARRIAWSGPVEICVLDDGRRAWVDELCSKHGARWITRPGNQGAKAGNINHALGVTSGEFILFLDADFLAHPEAVARLMPVMDDPTVAIAQAPQHFYNDDPVTHALGVQGHIGDEQAMFFDRILPARDRGGFAFFCGTCALLRRAALVEAGGLPTDAVTEDILLSVYLRKRGWQTRYLERPVATGLAPESMHAFYVQRRRWARGAIQLLYLRSGLFARGISLQQRFAFLPLYWVVSPIVRIASLVVPQCLLLFGWEPLHNATDAQMLRYQGPMVIAMMGLTAFLYRHRWSPIVSSVWADLIAIGIAPSVLVDLVAPFRDKQFHVTPKGRAASAGGHDRRLAIVVAAGVALTLAAIVRGALPDASSARGAVPGIMTFSMFWALINLGRLLGITVALWRQVSPGDPRLEIKCDEQHGFVLLAGKGVQPLSGWHIGEDRVKVPAGATIAPRSRIGWRGPNGRIGVIARVEADGRLEFSSSDARSRLLSLLVAAHCDAEKPYRPVGALTRAAAQMFGLTRSEKPA